MMFPNKSEDYLMNYFQNSLGDIHSTISSILRDDGMVKGLLTQHG